MAVSYDRLDPSAPKDQVRLLLNDIPSDESGDDSSAVFSDVELDVFLSMEGGHVKLAAAQAIDTNALNEALASKVLRTQDVQVDGAKLAAAMHALAESLRERHYNALEDDGFFEIVESSPFGVEHTNWGP